ncbi:hypothetical protein [Aliamphritea ceti]|uniref:hypothetical protein n=1 Tax=Aliamphritea ceti TaxID=1524258 RepID=UPI0021C2F4B1|nr:hypothetical protein [Aliamphritea ceti]
MRYIQAAIMAVLLLGLSLTAQADTKRFGFLEAQPVLIQSEILSVAELTERIQATSDDMLGMNLIPHAQGYMYQLQRRDQHGKVRIDFVDAYTGDALSRLTVQQLLAGAKYYTF